MRIVATFENCAIFSTYYFSYAQGHKANKVMSNLSKYV